MSTEAFDIMEQMFKYNSEQRITAAQCLQHDYFRDVPQSLKSMANSNNNRRSLRNRGVTQASNINSDLPIGGPTAAPGQIDSSPIPNIPSQDPFNNIMSSSLNGMNGYTLDSNPNQAQPIGTIG